MTKNQLLNEKVLTEETITAVAKPAIIPKISIEKPKKRTSGLSLKSIREKKEHLIRQMDVVIDEDDLT